MLTKTKEGFNTPSLLISRVKIYASFMKLRLASLVVFSAMVSYLYAVESFSLFHFFILTLGGFLVTGASNGLNQIIEKDFDKLMERTQNRPIPQGDMNSVEGIIVVAISGVIGIALLGFFLNPLSGLLGALAMLMYAGIYTPLKRKTSWAVIVGAVPGAIPPMLGYVAVTGEFGLVPGVLFLIQFAWQLPHFWSIAWKLDDDYKAGGFNLLPINNQRDAASAWVILLTSIAMVPVGLLPFYIGETTIFSAIFITAMALWMVFYSVKLVLTLDEKMALRVMFVSFAYLPLVQLALMFDKLFLA